MPPLRDRRSDIVPLATSFLDVVGRELGRQKIALSRGDADALRRHDWPGNVRELRNVIERAVILSTSDHLRLDLAIPSLAAGVGAAATGDLQTGSWMTAAAIKRVECESLIAALEHTGWRISGTGGAAELLGLKPSTLSYRMKVLKIYKPKALRS